MGKKLIEVALPLDAINAAGAKEKTIRHGHPSTVHLWWARRPLSVARAILFAQLVDDPGGERGWGRVKGQTKADAEARRAELFRLIESLVRWENSGDVPLFEGAKAQILASAEEEAPLPVVHDPFAGGGTIPLEATRLGCRALASDLNPVAVAINKALLEVPGRFSGIKPVAPSGTQLTVDSSSVNARGLAEDVRFYGAKVYERAFARVGGAYPPLRVSKEVAKANPGLAGR